MYLFIWGSTEKNICYIYLGIQNIHLLYSFGPAEDVFVYVFGLAERGFVFVLGTQNTHYPHRGPQR